MDVPLTGYLILKEVGGDIASIESQLVRIETYEYQEQIRTDKTEIQNLQIADGNIPLGLELPIFVVLPRYFSSASFNMPKVSVSSINANS